MTPTEWVAEPEQALDLPPTILDGLRYVFSVAAPISLSGHCEEFVLLGPHAVQLTGVLCDTSERHQGITFKKRVTWRDELVIVGAPLTLAKLHEGELRRAYTGASR